MTIETTIPGEGPDTLHRVGDRDNGIWVYNRVRKTMKTNGIPPATAETKDHRVIEMSAADRDDYAAMALGEHVINGCVHERQIRELRLDGYRVEAPAGRNRGAFAFREIDPEIEAKLTAAQSVARATPPHRDTIELPTPGRLVYLYDPKRPKEDQTPVAFEVWRVDAENQRISGHVWQDRRDWDHEVWVEHYSRAPAAEYGWDWMPYQRGQLKQTEAAMASRLGMTRAPTLDELDRRFTYHAPKPGQTEKYTTIREQAKLLARLMSLHCPPCDELARALDHLDNAVFNANAAIARHGE